MAANINNRVVIDASSILSFIFPDEPTPKEVLAIFRKSAKGLVVLLAPNLLYYEIGNAIRSTVKQKRINELTATSIIEIYNQLKIIYFEPNNSDTMYLSLKHNLSFYDASYLSLCKEKQAKLLTLDKKLKACKP